MNEQPRAPRHLKSATRKWYEEIARDYEMDAHHYRLLAGAASAWDRAEAARKALSENGLTFLDRFNQPRARPECNIARDSMILFSRLLREIGLDAPNLPSVPRPIALPANDGRNSERRAS